MPGAATETYQKAVAEVVNILVSCDGMLDAGETISGISTTTVLVNDVATPGELTVSNQAVNVAAVQVKGVSTAIGKVILATLTGGTAGKKYEVRFLYTTTGSQTLQVKNITVSVIDT